MTTIARLPFPAADPVYGKAGPLIDIWVHKKSAIEVPSPAPARKAPAKPAKKSAKAAKPKQKPKAKTKAKPKPKKTKKGKR